MFSFIDRLFRRKKDKGIKQFSTTLTSANEGEDSLKNLSPDMKQLVESLNEEFVTSETLNTVSKFFFNTPEFKPGVYTFNKPMTDGMCFTISQVKTIFKENGDLDDIHLILNDVVFMEAFSVTVSIKNFHEFFNNLNINQINQKETTNGH